MVNVITVRIPDSLAERLEPLKSQINISEVCRSALEAKILTHELIEQTLSDEDTLRGLIQRLQIQKKDADDRSYIQGQEDGKNWAIREATYQELGSWGLRGVRHYRAPKNNYEAQSAEWDEMGNLQFEVPFPESQTAQRYLDSRQKAAERENQPFEVRKYRTGFLDAVRELWNQVKRNLD